MVTIIIPFLNSCPERLRNLNYILGAIEFSNIPCIVMEQVPEWELGPVSENIKRNDILHKYHKYDGPFQKSKIINDAVKLCSTKYVWILDADVYLDFNKIISELKNQDIIKPFLYVEHLTEERTKSFMNRVARKPEESFPRCDYFGKYSIIIKREIFNSIGGFDERFEGWGWEDLDFVHNKLQESYAKVETTEAVGLHLYHPTASKEFERKNFYIYKKNAGKLKKLSFAIHIKNRLDQLKETLPQNLKDNRDHSPFIEFALVDFASNDNASEWVISNFAKEIEEGYLKLYKTFDFPFWHASIAKNTSHHLSEGEIIVNLDCDNFTGYRGGKHLIDIFQNKNTLAVHQFCREEWFSGNYGRIAIRSQTFEELGGYDESFYNMGYQDTDLINRLEAKFPDSLIIEKDPDYNKAIKNDKDKSIENVPRELRKKGFFWMNDKNEELSKKKIKNNELVANNNTYGIRNGVLYYDPKLNSFSKITA